MKKLIYLITALIFLIITKPVYATKIGTPCVTKSTCDYGLICATVDAGKKECAAGPGNASCDTGGDAVCGNGYTCKKIDATSGLECVGSLGDSPGTGGTGTGVSIGLPFMVNFTNGIPTSFGAFVTNSLSTIYTIALILVLIYLVWGAYRYMISGGDPKAVAAARAQLTWAIVGMIIVFLSYGIFQVVNSLLNSVY